MADDFLANCCSFSILVFFICCIICKLELLTELNTNPTGIPEHSKSGADYAFHSPAAVHLLTPYGASTHPKTEKTVADLRKEVSAHS